MSVFSLVGMLQNSSDGAHHPFPLSCFRRELLSAGARELIETCAAIELGRAPFRLDEALPFQSLQGRIQRAVIDEEIFFGGALNSYSDAVPMTRTKDQRLENQHVQSALEELHGSWV